MSGIGQALQQYPEFRFYQTRNEQAMVHTAIGFAKHSNRLRAFVCTSSIGPGATNMITGAATATVNRLPVLLLPGDIFARRNVAPVLQQLESEHTQDISRQRLLQARQPLLGPHLPARADHHGAARSDARADQPGRHRAPSPLRCPRMCRPKPTTIPVELFAKRVWTIPRNRPDAQRFSAAAEWIRSAERPLIVAGGGVLYSEATEALAQFVDATGIPVGETMAGKGSLRYDHPLCTGRHRRPPAHRAANMLARDADLVIGIGTRYSDFTTASKTQFQHPERALRQHQRGRVRRLQAQRPRR